MPLTPIGPTTITAYQGQAVTLTPSATNGTSTLYPTGIGPIPPCFPEIGVSYNLDGQADRYFSASVLSSAVGSFPLTFAYVGQGTVTYTINVTAAVKVTSLNIAQGVQGTVYSGSGSSYIYKFAYATGFAATSAAVSGSLPPGISINATGIYGTPAKAGTYPLSIILTNANGSVTFQLTLTIVAVPHVTNATTSYSLIENAACKVPITTDVPTTSLTVDALPAGLSLVAGVVTGTPTATGTTVSTFTATNSAGSTTKAITFHVITTPNFTSQSIVYTQTGASFSFTPTCDDPSATIAITTALPSWLSFTAGALSGMPPSAQEKSAGS